MEIRKFFYRDDDYSLPVLISGFLCYIYHVYIGRIQYRF